MTVIALAAWVYLSVGMAAATITVVDNVDAFSIGGFSFSRAARFWVFFALFWYPIALWTIYVENTPREWLWLEPWEIRMRDRQDDPVEDSDWEEGEGVEPAPKLVEVLRIGDSKRYAAVTSLHDSVGG